MGHQMQSIERLKGAQPYEIKYSSWSQNYFDDNIPFVPLSHKWYLLFHRDSQWQWSVGIRSMSSCHCEGRSPATRSMDGAYATSNAERRATERSSTILSIIGEYEIATPLPLARARNDRWGGLV